MGADAGTVDADGAAEGDAQSPVAAEFALLSVEEKVERSKNIIYETLLDKGPLVQPELWEAVRNQTAFRSKSQFSTFLGAMKAHGHIRPKPDPEKPKGPFKYHAIIPSKWEKAVTEPDPEIGETTWQTLLPEDPLPEGEEAVLAWAVDDGDPADENARTASEV